MPPDGALIRSYFTFTKMSPRWGCYQERGCGEAQPQHVEFTNAFEKFHDAAVVEPAATGPADTVALHTNPMLTRRIISAAERE